MTTLHRLVRPCGKSSYWRVVANVPLLIAAKGKYINDANLAGFAMWQAGGDSGDILLDAISSGIGTSC